jgi:predicted flap endonuclease-1-like 5' DNA nuclease
MANRTIAEVLKTHDEVVKSIESLLESAGKPKPVSREIFVKQKEAKLTSMKKRLIAAKKDREAMIARMDREIELLNKRIGKFEKEIENDRNNLDDPVVPVTPVPVDRPARPTIRRIRGIGPANEEKLRAHGITKVSQVARMDKARLAEILGISEVRAVEFIKAAKRLG